MPAAPRETAWQPETPRLHPVRLLAAWIISALALLVAAGLVGGAEVRGFGGAVVVAALVAIVNAIVPPILAALRLPFTVGLGFLAVLAADDSSSGAEGQRTRSSRLPRQRRGAVTGLQRAGRWLGSRTR